MDLLAISSSLNLLLSSFLSPSSQESKTIFVPLQKGVFNEHGYAGRNELGIAVKAKDTEECECKQGNGWQQGLTTQSHNIHR